MHLIFIGDPAELERGGALSRQSITIEDVVFPVGQAVDASALPEKLLAKLAKNSHFKVVEPVAAEVVEASTASRKNRRGEALTEE